MKNERQTNIEYIKIQNLHGYYDYNVMLRDNRLILVGENGTGKSTFVTILYYLMTLQWDSLVEYSFEKIDIKIDSRSFEFPKETIIEYINKRHRHTGRYPREISLEVERFLKASGSDVDVTAANITQAYQEFIKLSRLNFPIQIFQEIIGTMQALNKDKKHICTEYEAYVREKWGFTIIYLPTYRRIEKEIKKIFPHMEEQIRHKVERRPLRFGPKKQVELIEFGMEDVTRLIQHSMVTLSNHFRSSLEALTGNYLRDVLLATYESADVLTIEKENIDQIDRIFARIDEKILTKRDKEALKLRIQEIIERQELSTPDKIILHFIQKLYNLHKEQDQREEQVKSFLNVCNNYLVNKKIQYRTNTYELTVFSDPQNDPLALESLSSGEKQIISIFAHLYLSDNMRYFLIIDEPELSLSVPWQKNFLMDISKSNLCEGMIAVTHSPFIYDNDLIDYTNSINKFRTVHSGTDNDITQ